MKLSWIASGAGEQWEPPPAYPPEFPPGSLPELPLEEPPLEIPGALPEGIPAFPAEVPPLTPGLGGQGWLNLSESGVLA